MKLKIKVLTVFSFLFCVAGFSQDPAKQEKAIYKISADKVKPASHSDEKKAVAKEDNAIHSCEISPNKKQAVVTKKASDGTLSQEKFPIKENK